MKPTRREILLGGAALVAQRVMATEEIHPAPRGKADHCLFIWLGGGACHIDTWDPKRRGDPKAKKPGSYYAGIQTAIPGVQVCEHLNKCAKVLDRFTLLRAIHHDVVDEHAAATNFMHTGRMTSGTVVYPSIGSIVAHQRGPLSSSAPAYVLIGYPNVTRGPGFLGQRAGYVYLTDTQSGPSGFTRAADVSSQRQARREKLLAQLRQQYKDTSPSTQARDYDTAISEALRLSGPEFLSAFDLRREPDSIRNTYGGEFGQRCLLARRLVQRGVRFVEISHNLNFVNGTGWDTHNQGQLNQHLLIEEMDTALSALVLDLEQKQLLDKTLVVVATEFGRPAGFDAGGGRGHHSKSFSVVMAGGGLRHCRAFGTTDELGMKIVADPVSVPDYLATICATLGINPSEELYDNDRPVPITDNGNPVRVLFG